MSPIDDNTGSPAAVTFQRLEQWREITAAVDSALNIGGEPGMDLLVSRMAEWNEAVDEWTTALQTCLELGSRGLRDEALQWHADGFFEIGDGLHAPVQRAGWDDWRQALEDRQIPLPQFDLTLRESVRSLVDELRGREIAGRSLEDQIDGLRRNVLIRGDLGERLTLLDSIRTHDAGREIWTEMIAPIRKRRGDRLEADILAALDARNFTKLGRLVEEARAVNWEEQLSGRVVALVNAVHHLLRSRDVLHALGESAVQVTMRARELEKQPIHLPSFPTVLHAALQARKSYLSLRQQLMQALQQAASVQQTKAVALDLALVEEGRQIDASTKPVLTHLGHQEQFERLRLQFCKQEDNIQRMIQMAPAPGGSWDEFKQKSSKWLERSGDLRIETVRLCSGSPDFVPPSTKERLAELDASRHRVQADRDRVVFNEKVVIGAVIGGLFLAILVIVIVVAVAANRSSR